MGRGRRQLPTLAFSPLPASPSQSWAETLSRFEQEHLHSQGTLFKASHLGDSPCEIPIPYGAPRFVIVRHAAAPASAHVFHYYTTAEALLSALLPTIRTFTPVGTVTDVLEYEDNDFWNLTTFGDDITVSLRCRSSPCIRKTSPATQRSRSTRTETRRKHAAAIAAAHPDANANLLAKGRNGRFLFSILGSSGELIFHVTNSLAGVETAISFITYPNAFVNLYDLDVSDRPLEIRLALLYTDSAGVTHEVVEP